MFGLKPRLWHHNMWLASLRALAQDYHENQRPHPSALLHTQTWQICMQVTPNCIRSIAWPAAEGFQSSDKPRHEGHSAKLWYQSYRWTIITGNSHNPRALSTTGLALFATTFSTFTGEYRRHHQSWFKLSPTKGRQRHHLDSPQMAVTAPVSDEPSGPSSRPSFDNLVNMCVPLLASPWITVISCLFYEYLVKMLKWSYWWVGMEACTK